MPEILAPAGDEAAFNAALNAGADAIYLGLNDFSARKSAANFSLENLKEHTARAHVLGAKVYVALNTLVKDGETESFFNDALGAWNAGADALIVQDVFLGKLLKRTYPEMILHLSTQAGVCNVYGARLAKRYGFSRVILARETPLEDIRAIASEIETEVFVQGALCTCFSGQCYMSAFAGGNSGNRGYCKQPCRKKYSVDRRGFEEKAYAVSLSDLCVGKEVFELSRAGVASFKIEGRMRSAAYAASAVRYYKDILSGAGESVLRADFSDLKRAFNRGNYTRGYLYGQDKNLLSRRVQGHMGERVGVVASLNKNAKYAYISSSFQPSDGDGFKVIRGGAEEVGGGEYRASFPKARGGFYLLKNPKYRVGDEVFLTCDEALSARISSRKRLLPITIDAAFTEGVAPEIRIFGAFGERSFLAPFEAESAKSRPFTEEDFSACFQKTDDFPFAVTVRDIRISGNLFIVKSALNAFRRGIYRALYEQLSLPREALEKREPSRLPLARLAEKGDGVAVIDRSFSGNTYGSFQIDHAILKPKNYHNLQEVDEFLENSRYYARHKWLYLPAYATGKDLALIGLYVSRFDGVYGEGIFALEYCREHGISLFAGVGFNLFNRFSAAMLAEEAPEEYCLSKELSASEIARTGCGGFVLSGGGIKVMDLGHCLFGRSCADCDRKSRYTMTDERGRQFPLMRYENSDCRFEVYNCAALVSEFNGNRLYDFTSLSEEQKAAYLHGEGPKPDGGKYTAGALKNGVR